MSQSSESVPQKRKLRHDDRLSSTQAFLSGAIAGILARTITSPLDVAKTLAQVGTREAHNGFLQTLRNVSYYEGLKGHFRGNAAACLRLVPFNFIQLSTYNTIKTFFVDPETYKFTPLNALLAGSVSGAVATVLTYPLDFVKTRLTVNSIDPQRRKYRGIVDCFRIISAEETKLIFIRGLGTTLLGTVPFAAGTFIAFEAFEGMFAKPRQKQTEFEHFLTGCFVAAVAQTLAFPFDTIRKKMQTTSPALPYFMKSNIEAKGMIETGVEIVNTYGYRGLWRGNVANLIRIVPFSALMFFGYEFAKRPFLYANGFTTDPISGTPAPNVDQDMNPDQLRAFLKQHKHLIEKNRE